MTFEYDSGVTVIPEYITIDIYKRIIENAFDVESPEIEKIKCSMGSSSDTNVLSVIIKCLEFPESADFLETLQVAQKEKTLYHDILPQLEKLSGNLKFGPRLYHSISKPINTLFFEDLNAIDFKMASREKGLDEVHTQLTLKRLAYFHASSMVLQKDHPSIVKDFQYGMLDPAGCKKESGMLYSFFSGSANNLLALVEKWPGYELILQKLRKYVGNLHENLISSQAPSSKDTFNVLNHGDLWVNNMLFKYDATGQHPVDILFVDFQLSIWGSPGIDLNYFFYTSLQLDLLKHKLPTFLEYYHNELIAALEYLKYKGTTPSLEQIHLEFKNRAAYGFFANFAIFPIIAMDKKISGDSNLDNFADEDFKKKKLEAMYRSKRLEETLKYTLKEFDKLGLWD